MKTKTLDQWVGEGGFVHRLREHEDGDLDVQFLGGSWQNIGDRAALYRLKEVLGERASGAETEGARVRRGLIDAIADQREEWALARPIGCEMVKSEREMGADAAFMVVLAALDRVCPEEK